MAQRDFRNWEDYLSIKYNIGKKEQHRNPFRTKTNFGWGEGSDGQMVHHPEVWFRNSFSTNEPGKKYESPLHLNPSKEKDLQKMARNHISEPKEEFYMRLKSSGAITLLTTCYQ